MTAQEVATVLTPLVPLAALALGLYQERRLHSTRAARRRQVFEDAKSQVAFVESWWRAHEAVAESPEVLQEARAAALCWLNECRTPVDEVERAPTAAEEATPLRGLFLAYPLRGRFARLLRAGFYLALGISLLYGLVAVVTSAGPAAHHAHAQQDFATTVFFVVTALVLRAWAAAAAAAAASKEPDPADENRPTAR